MNIGKNCHKIIIWSELNKKLSKFLNHRRQSEFHDPRIIDMMKSFTRHMGKWYQYLDEISDENEKIFQDIPRKDKHMVIRAISFLENEMAALKPEYDGIYIVTEDNDFHSSMKISDEITNHGIVPLRAKDALDFSENS